MKDQECLRVVLDDRSELGDPVGDRLTCLRRAQCRLDLRVVLDSHAATSCGDTKSTQEVALGGWPPRQRLRGETWSRDLVQDARMDGGAVSISTATLAQSAHDGWMACGTVVCVATFFPVRATATLQLAGTRACRGKERDMPFLMRLVLTRISLGACNRPPRVPVGSGDGRRSVQRPVGTLAAE